jgi:hypothetical protein
MTIVLSIITRFIQCDLYVKEARISTPHCDRMMQYGEIY